MVRWRSDPATPVKSDYRGTRFSDHPSDLKARRLAGVDPAALIEQIHLTPARGAEIVETNTFNANAVSMEDYDLVHLSREAQR